MSKRAYSIFNAICIGGILLLTTGIPVWKQAIICALIVLIELSNFAEGMEHES